jgi:hypothetical protein
MEVKIDKEIQQHTKSAHKATQQRYINTFQHCQQFYRQPIYSRHPVQYFETLTSNAAPAKVPTV